LEVFKKVLMNFLITTDNEYKNELNLNHIRFKEFNLYFDNGWQVYDNRIKKGTTNNYCEIIYINDLKINHNTMRDFGLWYNQKTCTNIFELENYLPVDGEITYNNGWHITYKEGFYKTTDKIFNTDQAVDFIKDILLDNTKDFVSKNNKELVVFENNGIDSLLSRSVLDFLGVDYKIYKIEKLKYTPLQKQLVKKYYGFNQIQLFEAPTCIITGFYGDEYLLRNPGYIQSLIRDEKIDLVEIFEKTESCYMKDFFNKTYLDKCKKITKQTKQKVKEMICNDIQVWHIDNTFVFSPFKDKRFLELLNCDLDTTISQVTDGTISKKLIKYFNPELSKKIDKSKNSIVPYWFD